MVDIAYIYVYLCIIILIHLFFCLPYFVLLLLRMYVFVCKYLVFMLVDAQQGEAYEKKKENLNKYVFLSLVYFLLYFLLLL